MGLIDERKSTVLIHNQSLSLIQEKRIKTKSAVSPLTAHFQNLSAAVNRLSSSKSSDTLPGQRSRTRERLKLKLGETVQWSDMSMSVKLLDV